MTNIELPVPKIKIRKLNENIHKAALDIGLNSHIARILARRPIEKHNLAQIIEPKLALLEHPEIMQDMKLAAKRLAKAIINQECIGIETDHDCDGQTSHAVIYYNLTKHFKHPKHLIKSYIGHRLTEGYGLSMPVVAKILNDNPRATIVITADNGSSDEPRIAKLKQHGIDVIITDHHQIPKSGLPISAYAWVNPTREDCNYDPYIAGCMVAWLLMVATRIELINLGYLAKDSPRLQDSLDYVAVGTVADCVSFAKSHINRAVVNFGLKLINSKTKFCWQALNSIFKNNIINTEDLGFKIAPLLNSDGRLASAFGSVSFLLSENLQEAVNWLEDLKQQNILRRNIQKTITFKGLIQAKQQVEANYSSLCIFLKEGHVGVHGISASRIKDNFGRPAAFFAPKFGDEQLISGSFRGIELFNVREALQYVANQDPNILISFGGHIGAGGATLKADDFYKFRELFEQATKLQLGKIQLGPVIWSDGELSRELINLDFLNQLKILEPFGKDFEAPVFHATAIIEYIKIIGDGTHARLNLNIDGKIFSAIWFNIRHKPEDCCLFNNNDKVTCAFSLIENDFNNIKNCELQIIGMYHI